MSDYWMARMGRSKFARYFPSGALTLIGTVYYGYHTLGQNMARDFYGYYNPDGKKDTISSQLRMMIAETFIEARQKHKLGREYFENKFSGTPSFTWFASSTLEPINIGMTEFRTGVTIGLPYFYNYTSTEDIPDQALELKKVQLFRDPIKGLRKKSKAKDDPSDETRKLIQSTQSDEDIGGPKFRLLKRFDRKSEEGKEFMETLVLSDDAKRFSIARELFLADCYRVPTHVLVILGAGMTAIFAARLSVSFFKVLKSPISVRTPYYLLSGTYGYGLYKIGSDAADKHYYIKARDRAKSLGENYEKGAEEYFAKAKLRREILSRPPPDEEY